MPSPQLDISVEFISVNPAPNIEPMLLKCGRLHDPQIIKDAIVILNDGTILRLA